MKGYRYKNGFKPVFGEKDNYFLEKEHLPNKRVYHYMWVLRKDLITLQTTYENSEGRWNVEGENINVN